VLQSGIGHALSCATFRCGTPDELERVMPEFRVNPGTPILEAEVDAEDKPEKPRYPKP
jgi:hypothetical protein